MMTCGKENTTCILSRSPGKEGLISRLRVYSIFLLPSNCRSVLCFKYRICLRTSPAVTVRLLQDHGACLHISGLDDPRWKSPAVLLAAGDYPMSTGSCPKRRETAVQN
jgi:hypothetical protein